MLNASFSYHFNSRPREEVDQTTLLPSFLHMISTHDLARRSTNNSLNSLNDLSVISTHDLARRSTVYGRKCGFKTDYFNSRPREEVDGSFFAAAAAVTSFQLTTSRGGRQAVSTDTIKKPDISTHDLARRSTAIFTQKVFLSKSLFVLIAYNIFILY